MVSLPVCTYCFPPIFFQTSSSSGQWRRRNNKPFWSVCKRAPHWLIPLSGFFSAFWLAAWRSSPISSAFSEDRCTRFYCEVPKNWQNKSLFLVHFVQKSSSGFNSSTFKPFQMKSVTVIAPFSFWNVEAQNFGNNWFIFRLREEVRCTAFCRLISYFRFGPNLFCVSKSWTVRPLSTGLNKP